VVESADLDTWRRFGIDTLGLMAGDNAPDGSLRLRMDERPFRIAVMPGDTNRFLAAGWEFRDRTQFEACLASLRAADVTVELAEHADATARCVTQLARCTDPAGNRVELYWGRALDYKPFASPQGLAGFVTGNMGMGHVVLPAPQLDACQSFYQRHLGFAVTDEMWLDLTGNPEHPPLGLYFMHAENPRHHNLALMGAPVPSGCVHIMLEARTLDDVGHALDRCMSHGVHISSTLGKHSNDRMVSFYALTPGGFDIELGCMGLQIDWSQWVPTRSLVPDLWGHRWAPPSAK
jgi:3,4-dihydroxy-9,10-secoandrosta-1,3,5(10)-triene-9,17-dione 4,5-dioxygenase